MDPITSAMSPEQRMAARKCPECGETVTRHSAPHHIVNHWPWPMNPDDPKLTNAIARKALLVAFVADQNLMVAKAQAAAGEGA